jgi:ribosomal protein S18 acetylase RimI-like enzyme
MLYCATILILDPFTMFVSTELAAQIDIAEAGLTLAVGRALQAQGTRRGLLVELLDGGVAMYAGPMSPMNKMIGVGFRGLPDASRLDAIEAHFAAAGEPLQAEVSSFADPAFMQMLAARGYLLSGFENVLGRVLHAADGEDAQVADVTVRRMEAHEDTEWLKQSIDGFMHADTQGIAAPELPPREFMESALEGFILAPGFLRYGAWIDGELAGVGAMRIDGQLAQLCGATTQPGFRRRGVQTALLRHRLAVAVEAGCTLVLMTTQPGSKSHENGCKQGFVQLLNRAVMIRPPGQSV